MSKARLVLWLPAAVLFIGLIWFAQHAIFVGLWPMERTELVPDAQQMGTYARLLNMSFPASTRPIKVLYIDCREDAMWLKLEIAREDIPALIAASPFAGEELSDTRKSIREDFGLDWWDPDSVKTFQSGETVIPYLDRLNILIDTGIEGKAIVYLEWLQT